MPLFTREGIIKPMDKKFIKNIKMVETDRSHTTEQHVQYTKTNKPIKLITPYNQYEDAHWVPFQGHRFLNSKSKRPSKPVFLSRELTL